MSFDNNKKQIVMFGGCFNPPLNSHLSLAEQMINEYSSIEKVVFMPVNSKYEKASLIDNEHRYNMLKLVCDKNENFEVSRIELDYERQLCSVETLRELKKIYPNNEIVFLTGSDNLKEIDKWEKGDELVKEFKIYVLERGNDNVDKMIEENSFLNKNRNTFIKTKIGLKSNFSSTYARDKIKNNKSIRYLTQDDIILYIEKNKLYK